MIKINIYAVKVSKCKLTNGELESHIPDIVLKNIKRYKNALDYRRSLIAYSTLYAITLRLKKFPLEELTIEKNECGKPFFSKLSNYSFNISHSKDWIVVAISSDEIGIDVEYNEEFDYCEVVEAFFSEKEKKLFFDAMNHEQAKVFYQLWTLKESYIKAIGQGMMMKLDSFDIELLEKPITTSGNTEFEMAELALDNDYTLSVCYQIGEEVTTPSILKLESLIDSSIALCS